MFSSRRTNKILATGTLALALMSIQPVNADQLALLRTDGSTTTSSANHTSKNIKEIKSASPSVFNSKIKRQQKKVLKGSKESLDRQNTEAEYEGLEYIKDADRLDELVNAGVLVALPENNYIQVDPNLPEWRRYVLPQTRLFLIDLAEAHAKQFPKAHKLTVSSAVRPLDVQEALMSENPNASDRSVHPTGAVVDVPYGRLKTKEKGLKKLRYPGMKRKEKRWMEAILLKSNSEGLTEAIEEHYEPCFHIMVFADYNDQMERWASTEDTKKRR